MCQRESQDSSFGYSYQIYGGQQVLHTMCACAAFLTCIVKSIGNLESIRLYPCTKSLFQQATPMFRASIDTLAYLSLDTACLSAHSQSSFIPLIRNVTNLKLACSQPQSSMLDFYGLITKCFTLLPRLAHIIFIAPSLHYAAQPVSKIDDDFLEGAFGCSELRSFEFSGLAFSTLQLESITRRTALESIQVELFWFNVDLETIATRLHDLVGNAPWLKLLKIKVASVAGQASAAVLARFIEWRLCTPGHIDWKIRVSALYCLGSRQSSDFLLASQSRLRRIRKSLHSSASTSVAYCSIHPTHSSLVWPMPPPTIGHAEGTDASENISPHHRHPVHSPCSAAFSALPASVASSAG